MYQSRLRIKKWGFSFLLLLARWGAWRNLSWEGYQTVFIVSTGRTGTQLLSSFFDQYEHIVSLHEPAPNFLRLGNDVASGKISQECARRRVTAERKLVLRKLDPAKVTMYIESNNMLFSLIPVIRSVFPKCTIIHIVRDGRDVVRSGFSRPWYASNDPMPRIRARDFPDDPFFSTWDELSRFEKICWWWQKRDTIIYESVENRADSITLKYEDIFDKERGFPGVGKILEFVGLDAAFHADMFSNKVNFTKEYVIPHWTEWDASLRRSFLTIAGERLTFYGYPDF
jgi:hypothetical protein